MNFLKALLQKTKKNFENIPSQLSDEVPLNKKAYEIAESSMKALLENNYRLHGIKYYRDNSLIYLANNEFLRDTEAFRAFIENPHERTQWNFSSKEINYESGMVFNYRC